jgi:tRNA C32,U32 (ribose-2'-O)-methylase TrmJ
MKKMSGTNEATVTLEVAHLVATLTIVIGNATMVVAVTMISRKKNTYLEKVFEL